MKKIFAVLLAVAMLIPCIAYAASGTAKYYQVAGDGNTASIAAVVTYLKQMYYLTTNTYLPTATTVASGMKSSNIWIVHGHGSPTKIRCDQTNGTEQYLGFDESNLAVDIAEFSSNALSSTSYALYISCKSGESSSNGNSFVSITRGKGAKTVTGFKKMCPKVNNGRNVCF